MQGAGLLLLLLWLRLPLPVRRRRALPPAGACTVVAPAALRIILIILPPILIPTGACAAIPCRETHGAGEATCSDTVASEVLIALPQQESSYAPQYYWGCYLLERSKVLLSLFCLGPGAAGSLSRAPGCGASLAGASDCGLGAGRGGGRESVGLPASDGAVLLLPGAPSALHSKLLRHRRADDIRDALARNGNVHAA